MVEIISCHTRHELRTFQALPEVIYRRNWRYSHPLPQPISLLYNAKKNPLLRNGDHMFLIAVEDDRLIMRILTGTDDVYNKVTRQKRGYISLFDGYNRPDVAQMMMARVVEFQKKIGNTSVIGPNPPDHFGFGLGVLVDGFDEIPGVFCHYNDEYYEQLLLSCGMRSYSEHYGYMFRLSEIDTTMYDRVSDWAARRFSLSVEPCDFNAGPRVTKAIHKVMRDINRRFTIGDTESIIHFIKPHTSKFFSFIAYKDGEPAGYLLALPDGCLRRQKKVDLSAPGGAREPGIRVVTLYVSEKNRGGGTTAVLFSALLRAAREHGISWIQAGTIDAENLASVAGCIRAGGVVNRVYRQYQLTI